MRAGVCGLGGFALSIRRGGECLVLGVARFAVVRCSGREYVGKAAWGGLGFALSADWGLRGCGCGFALSIRRGGEYVVRGVALFAAA